MAPESVTVLEHITALMNERQRSQDVQFRELKQAVTAVGDDVRALRSDHVTLAGVVAGIQGGEQEKAKLRATDYARIGALVTVLTFLLSVVTASAAV